ncbi:MAG: hypothetical protein H0X04_00085 [Chthoniobacterales bacterium]|nr:hypothetical protein [Chthoniobacterales bacterium]
MHSVEFFQKVEKHGLEAVIRESRGIPDDQLMPDDLCKLADKARKALYMLRKKAYFLCPPHLLDVTQPEDWGYGTPTWEKKWKALKSRNLKIDLPYKLSHGLNLRKSVTTVDRVHSYKNVGGMLPEFSINRLGRRCLYVRANGMRCACYGEYVLCAFHLRELKKMSDPFIDSIKSESLRESVKRHLESPERKTLNTELAIQRAMLEALMSRFEEARTLADINSSEIALIMHACKYISETVEKCANIEAKMNKRLTFDQIQQLLDNMVKTVVVIMQPSDEQMCKLATELENLHAPRMHSDDPKMLTYGEDTPVGVKDSSIRDAYTETERVQDQWTTAEVREQKASWDRKGPWKELNADRERIAAELAAKMGVPSDE